MVQWSDSTAFELFFELLSHLLCLIQYSNRTPPSPLYTVYKIHRCIFYFRLREKKFFFICSSKEYRGLRTVSLTKHAYAANLKAILFSFLFAGSMHI